MRPHVRRPPTALLVAAVGLAATLAGCESTHSESAANERAISDSTITANVKAALVRDPTTRASNISVNTIDGTVELSGFVNTADQRYEAVREAQNIDGVRSVKDELAVNNHGEVVGSADSDEAITHRVQRALADSPQTSDTHISVATDDGVVQLAGFVSSHQQRDAAEDIAHSVQGVRKVDNDLRINPGD